MEEQLASLFQELDRRPTVAAYTEAARRLEALAADLRSARVALLASFTVEPLVPFLEVEAARKGFRADVYVGPFNSVAQELLDAGSGCARHRPDIVFVVQLLEDLAPAIAERFLELRTAEVEAAVEQAVADVWEPIARFRSWSSAVCVVSNFAQRTSPLLGIYEAAAGATQTETIRRLNARLASRLAGEPGVHVLDFDRVCADVGYRRWRNDTGWYLGRAALAAETLAELARVAGAYLQATLAAPRKCLVVDLDDTLWGGVLGEVGPEGIALGSDYPGAAYRDFQKVLLELRKQGVLLAVASKNDDDEAVQVLAEHPDMVLRPEHFAAMRINWHDKPDNLIEIAAELNLALDSMVFFDDNPAERALMRESLPQVETLEVPSDPLGYARTLLESRCFDKVSLTAEDRERGDMYRAQRERRELESAVGDLTEFYRRLEMVAEIEPLRELSFQRAHSLLQKTNQFNLTTRRHTEAALRVFADDPDAEVWTLRLRDRFGDNGIVGLTIVRLQEEAAVIDTFLLSCRVIGRTIETTLLAHVADRARRRGARRLLGMTRRTRKNEPFLDFYARHGFREVEAGDEETSWVLDLAEIPFANPDYIRVATAPAEVPA